jgi:hypothetical protein
MFLQRCSRWFFARVELNLSGYVVFGVISGKVASSSRRPGIPSLICAAEHTTLYLEFHAKVKLQ